MAGNRKKTNTPWEGMERNHQENQRPFHRTASFRSDDRDEGSSRGERRFDNRGNRDFGERKFENRGNRDFGERKFENRGNRDFSERKFENRGNRDFSERKFENRNSRDFGERRFENRAPRAGYASEDRRSNPPRTGNYHREVPKAVFDNGDAPVKQERRFENRAPRTDRPAFAERRPAAQFDAEELPKDPVLRNAAARAAKPDFRPEAEIPENLLVGRNPIREAIKTGHAIEKLLVSKGDLSGAARDIVRMALEKGVVVQEVERVRLDQIYPNHQGMLAYVAMAEYSTVEKIFENAQEKGEQPFIIILDGITDPHNLGAIIRSAECTGAHGVIIPERRSVGLTPACVKAAAGATEYMPVAKVTNINRTIEELQARGVWVMASAMDGENIYNVDLSGAVALVIGSEGDGVSALTLKKCDRVVSLPMKGHIDSLNASVAAGAMMYAVLQSRS